MAVTYFVRMKAKPGHAEHAQAALLENFEIVGRSRGNVVFALHRGIDDPNELWVYETWESADAVETHEADPAFLAYREKIRPLVEADVIWGNTQPFAVRGYEAGS